MYEKKKKDAAGCNGMTWWICVAIVFVCLARPVLAAESNALVPGPNGDMGSIAIDPNQAQVDFSDEGCLIKFIAFQKDSNIKDGLRLLAALCKKNIVPSANVEGPLTISRLYNVTFEEAIKAVLGYGFKYEQEGEFIRVYTTEEYKKIKEDPDRMVYKVITLYYTSAKEAAALITPVLSASSKIQQTSPAETTVTASGGGGAGGGATLGGSGGGDNMALNDMIVLFDYPENIAKAEEIIARVDVRPLQVLVEATIMSALLTEGMDLGVDWNLLSGVAISGFPALQGGVGTNIETTGFTLPRMSGGLRVGFSSDNVQALITALETTTDTTVLANPKILALNKQEGSVLIGRNLGYRSSTTISEGGVATEGEVRFLQTGTQLVFRPFVGNDGYIRMDIYPKDSTAELNDEGVPDETTTELKTNIMVKDGETVVIGGLFRDVTVVGQSQVPILGNLPLLGTLFRGKSDSVQREEVIIMLTPHIIEQPSETDPEGRSDDIRLKRSGTKKEMLAIERPRLAEDAYARAAQYYLEGNTEKALYNLKLSLIVRPTYLEALRLRERIIAESDPDEFKKIDSIVQGAIDEQEAANWQRR